MRRKSSRYSEEEVVGQNALEFVHPDEQEKGRRKFKKKVNQDREGIERVQFSFRHSNGDYVWIEALSRQRLDDPSTACWRTAARSHAGRRERRSSRNRTSDSSSLAVLSAMTCGTPSTLPKANLSWRRRPVKARISGRSRRRSTGWRT
ncbi:MAG: PAS domain-containing protein [Candidatus Nanohaloarchaea archaeon]